MVPVELLPQVSPGLSEGASSSTQPTLPPARSPTGVTPTCGISACLPVALNSTITTVNEEPPATCPPTSFAHFFTGVSCCLCLINQKELFALSRY